MKLTRGLKVNILGRSLSVQLDLGRLHDQSLVDVRDHTAASDGRFDEGVELFVAADGELQMAGSDALDLQVLARVACKLKHLGREVLKDRSRVDSGGGTDTAARVDSQLKNSVDSPDGELFRD